MSQRPPISAESRWLRIGLAAAILLVVGLLAVSGPGNRTATPFFPCGFHAVSGLPCLLCGGTRAARAILHGDLHAAVYLNALAFPSLALAAATVVVLLLEAAAARPLALRDALFRHLSRLVPVLVLPALAWWMVHIYFALRTPKPELVDFRNPIAARAGALAATLSR
jgi:hypothetical protein